MIAVDTSVWIAFFRNRERDRATARHLAQLLDRDEVLLPVPVRIEILAGARPADVDRLRRLLSPLPLLRPMPATWERLEAWAVETAARRERFGFGDLLIAGLAADHSAAAWSLDTDFERMAILGWLQLYHAVEPRPSGRTSPGST